MTAAELERVHCRGCRRRLFDASPAFLRPGAVLELKCAHCNAMNTLRGEAAPPAA